MVHVPLWNLRTSVPLLRHLSFRFQFLFFKVFFVVQKKKKKKSASLRGNHTLYTGPFI